MCIYINMCNMGFRVLGRQEFGRALESRKARTLRFPWSVGKRQLSLDPEPHTAKKEILHGLQLQETKSQTRNSKA